MDAKTHAEVGERLDAALDQVGILIQRADSKDGANLASWERVPSGALLGRLQQMTGWKISLVEPAGGRVVGIIEHHKGD